MKGFISSFRQAWSLFKKDKYVLLFSFIPVFIGILIYVTLGNLIYNDLYDFAKEYISVQVGNDGWFAQALSYIVVGLLSISFFFLVNWTFVLVVSLFASPFNDLISNRVEKLTSNEELPKISESISLMIKGICGTIVNEIKKILLIVSISIIGIVLGLFFPPLSIAITAILLAVSFLDYSWSRHNLNFKKCLQDIKSSFLGYFLSGLIFMVLISIPVVNLFALPFGVVYFTVLHTNRKIILGKYDK